MNENRMEIIKALATRRAQLWIARMCIINAVQIYTLSDDVRKRLNEMWSDLDEIVEQNDKQLNYWSTDGEEAEE